MNRERIHPGWLKQSPFHKTVNFVFNLTKYSIINKKAGYVLIHKKKDIIRQSGNLRGDQECPRRAIGFGS